MQPVGSERHRHGFFSATATVPCQHRGTAKKRVEMEFEVLWSDGDTHARLSAAAKSHAARAEIDPAVIALGNAEEARHEAAAKLTDWDAAWFAAHAANMPLTYWTGFDCESQVRHARLCDEFANQDALLLIDFKPDPARRITELTILTIDDPGLFARIAGAVAAAGANIVGARITTCHDGTVLDECV